MQKSLFAKRKVISEQIRCMLNIDADKVDEKLQAKLDLESKWELQTEVMKDGLFWEELVKALPSLVESSEQIAHEIVVSRFENYRNFDRVYEANIDRYVKLVQKMYCKAVLTSQGRWNSVPIDALYGIFSGEFDDDIELTRQFVEGFFTFVPDEDFIAIELDSGKFIVQCNIRLDASDLEKYRRMGSKYPMLFEPLESDFHNEGRFVNGTKNVTKNSRINRYTRNDVQSRLSKCPMYWNQFVLENFVFEPKINFSKKRTKPINMDAALASWAEGIDSTSEVYEEMKEVGLENEPMYAPVVVDDRHRLYPDGKVHYQKTEQLKALIEMKPRKINADGKEAIAIGFANAIGLDKKPIPERIEFIYSKTLEELDELANCKIIDTRYPKAYQLQGAQDEPTHAFYFNHLWKELNTKPYVISGATLAQDGVCQGGGLWGTAFQNATIMYYTCLTSGVERPDWYTYLCVMWFFYGNWEEFNELTKEEQKKYRNLTKEILKVLMYGGSSGCRPLFNELPNKELNPEEEFERVMEVIKHDPVFRTIQRLGKFWNPSWDSVMLEYPDGSRTNISAKITSYEDGELVEGVTIESSFLGHPILYRIKRKGKVQSSASLPPHVNHSNDAYIQAECTRINLPDWKQVRLVAKIREWRQRQKSSLIAEDLKTKKKFSNKKFNPKSRKNAQLMYCLYKGEQIGWYSFRILDLITPENQEMVPDEVLDELFYYVAERSVPMWGIHDSIVCHVNDWKIVQNTYRYVFWRLAKSTLYQDIFDQLGIYIRIPHRNHRLCDEILRSVNLFG